MFREIRRKNREIGPGEAKKLLAEARRGVLSVNGDNNYPYAVPVNYCYDDEAQRIFFHGSRAGHKADALKKCDKVCFTVFGGEIVREEAWAPFVRSVVVFGRCHPIEDRAERLNRLKQFAAKYYPSESMVDEEILRSGKAVQMYEIEIEHLRGKEVQER